MARRNKQVGALLLALGLCATAAWTQQKDPRVNAPVQPVSPAGESPSKGSADSSNPAIPAAVVSDNRPLSGAEQFGLGTGAGQRNILLMGFQFREVADSNSTSTTSGSSWDSASLLTGNVALHHFWSRSELTAAYAGGGALYNTRTGLNEAFHEASLTEKMNWRRWTLLLSDQASYLPESSFGFSGLSSLAGLVPGVYGLGSQFPTISPLFDPSQSILTGRARRISNAVVGEVDYSISRRSSFTASGSYGLLHFLDDGFIDNHSTIFRSGYNYALNSRDTVGVVYTFTRFSFGQQSATFQNQAIQLAYGRRITGRLALELFAGPQINTFQNVSTNPGAQVSWSAGAFVRYQMARSGVALSYIHGTSGGSGVFAGAERDQVEAYANRKLSQRLAATAHFGYARNRALRELLPIIVNSRIVNSRFDSWYGGAGLSRPLGRRASIFFTYDLQRQTSDTSSCITGTCGTSYLRHQFALGFNLNLGQRGLD